MSQTHTTTSEPQNKPAVPVSRPAPEPLCAELDAALAGLPLFLETDFVLSAQTPMLLQRDGDDPLPALPLLELTPPSLLGPPTTPPFRLIPDLELCEEDRGREQVASLARVELDPSRLRTLLDTVDFGSLDLSLPPAIPSGTPVVPSVPPLVSPGAGPAVPREASAGDLLRGVMAIPVISQGMDRLSTLALDEVGRDWRSLATGGRVGLVTWLGVIGGGALAGIMANQESRAFALSQLNGRVLPIPGVPWLRMELYTGQDSLMVGTHLDVGMLLNQWQPMLGFGQASSITPIGGPPRPAEFVPGPPIMRQAAEAGTLPSFPRFLVGPADDPLERQADAVADLVTRMPEPVPDEAGESDVTASPFLPMPRTISTQDAGLPLTPAVRDRLEPVLGTNLGHVRVHEGASAGEAATALGAKAFTHQNHIWVGTHQSAGNVQLMAHELTHVVQQGCGTPTASPVPPVQLSPDGEGVRTATVTVPWVEDSVAFHESVIVAIGRSRGFRGVREASLWQPFRSPVYSLYRRLCAIMPPIEPGDPISVRASAYFDPEAYHGQVSGATVESEQTALLRQSTVTGIITSRSALPSGAPNRIGVSEVADLSFTASPATTAARLGGLCWCKVSGEGTVTSGTDGRATFTAGAAAGAVRLELRTVSGLAAGTVVATLDLTVVDWPVVGGVPGSTATATASMLDVTSWSFQNAGSVHAQTGTDAGTVVVESPPVTFAAGVDLRSTVTLPPAETVQVGPTQTMLASDRVGVYRRGGTATGEIIAERHMTVGQTRDAQWRESPSGLVAAVPEPWYSAPVTLTNDHRSDSVSFMDQPGFTLPMSVGDGQLTETAGQDSFLTSLAAKRGTSLVHLRSTNWSVPWTLAISPSGTGTGANVASTDVRFGPPTTAGPIAMASGADWLSFSSLDAAMTASVEVLMQNLVATRTNDPATGAIIADALLLKNPSFAMTITVVTKEAFFGDDEFTVEATGHNTAVRGEFSRGEGESVTVTIPLLSLFAPHSIVAGDSLNIRLTGVGDPVPSMSWDYPFNPQTSPASFTSGNGGHYTITGSLR